MQSSRKSLKISSRNTEWRWKNLPVFKSKAWLIRKKKRKRDNHHYKASLLAQMNRPLLLIHDIIMQFFSFHILFIREGCQKRWILFYRISQSLKSLQSLNSTHRLTRKRINQKQNHSKFKNHLSHHQFLKYINNSGQKSKNWKCSWSLNKKKKENWRKCLLMILLQNSNIKAETNKKKRKKIKMRIKKNIPLIKVDNYVMIKGI